MANFGWLDSQPKIQIVLRLSYALVGYILVILVFCFSISYGVLNPPNLGYYTTDEQFIADSGVFMLYGATPRCLDWPAIPMVLVFYILMLGQWVIELVANFSTIHGIADIFAVADRLVYNYLADRTAFIAIGRCAQILLSAGLLIPSIQLVSRSERVPEVVRLPLLVLMIVNPDTLTGFGVVRPEALAYSIALWLTLHLLYGNSQRKTFTTVALVLTGVLFAQRLIYVFFLPFWIGAIWLRLSENNDAIKRRLDWLKLLQLTGFLLFFTIWWVPFFWTDTLVLLKAFAGGVAAKMTHDGGGEGPFNVGFIRETLVRPDGFLIVLGSAVGALVFVRQYPGKTLAWLVIANGLLYLLNVLRSPLIYPTHVLPVRTIGIIWLAYGVGNLPYLRQIISQRKPLKFQLASLLIVVGLALWFIRDSYVFQRNAHQATNLGDVLAWYYALPADSQLAMDVEFSGLVIRSRSTVDYEIRATTDSTLTRQKLDRLASITGSSQTKTLPLLMTTSLLEDERLLLLQEQILRQYTPEKVYPSPRFFSEQAGFVNYFISTQQAFDGLKNGQYSYLVTSKQLPGQQPKKVFTAQPGVPYYAY